MPIQRLLALMFTLLYRLRMMPLPETSDIERMLSPVEDSGLTPRLLPAA